jgi:predicted transcriptional regulator
MANQLWTSTLTGYRRVGTRLSEVRVLFESGITAKAIYEPLKCCCLSSDAAEMRKLLSERGFDIAGVMETEEGRVIGFVQASSLESGLIQNFTKRIDTDYIISDSTPIANLLSILKDKDHVFVLSGATIAGIITRSDLNKPALRVYLFGLTSLLEMHITFWVRIQYPVDKWKSELSEERLKMAFALWEKRRNVNQEIDLVECLQFCDKLDLLLRDESWRKRLQIQSRSQGKRILASAQTLRDTLAHSQVDLSEGSNWERVFNTVSCIEELLHLSDSEIEKGALSTAMKYKEPLWKAR